MTDRKQYTPGPADGAQVRKDGENWTLILVRELHHAPEKVWQALTDTFGGIMLRLLIATLFSATFCSAALAPQKNEISFLLGGGSLIGSDESRGATGQHSCLHMS